MSTYINGLIFTISILFLIGVLHFFGENDRFQTVQFCNFIVSGIWQTNFFKALYSVLLGFHQISRYNGWPCFSISLEQLFVLKHKHSHIITSKRFLSLLFKNSALPAEIFPERTIIFR